MKIKIENVNVIKSAEIALNGLTVIAGENNTGKSTIEKLLFTIIKANKSKITPRYLTYNLGLDYLDFTSKFFLQCTGNDGDDITIHNQDDFLKLYNKIIFRNVVLIENTQICKSIHMFDFSTIDFSTNLVNCIKLCDSSSFNQQLLDSIANLIDGLIFYDKEKKDFMYRNNISKNTFKLSNCSSGIKSFGFIQLLIQSNFINSEVLLIIDNPETYLHPKWQVKYAKMIIEMVKHNIPVLLSTHSPYIIQALKVFSDANGLIEKTNFYLAEKNDDETSSFTNVNSNLNKLFKTMSEPLQELVWN
jgi:predicted ATPase